MLGCKTSVFYFSLILTASFPHMDMTIFRTIYINLLYYTQVKTLKHFPMLATFDCLGSNNCDNVAVKVMTFSQDKSNIVLCMFQFSHKTNPDTELYTNCE